MPTTDTREFADIDNAETVGTVLFDDGSQIDMSDESQDGTVIGLGKLDGSGWGEVALTWTALQVVADELNAQLRQARINGWL